MCAMQADSIVETRRDRWGRYLVVPPEGGKPVGYTRATTIAKTLDDTSALMSWGERMTALGLAQRPDLLAQVDDLRDDTKQLNRLCEKAKEAGGATVRRDLGTALHSILERSWTDPDYVPPASHVDDVTAVHRQLELAGLTPVEGMHERIVVNDQWRIAGTFDLLLRDNATQKLLIADIKTGSSVKYGSVGFAIQLCIYASADALYRQGAAADGSNDRREPMPQVAHDRAIIVHVQPGTGICELHELQLDVGLLSLAMAVREARKSKLLRPLTTADITRDIDRDTWIRERISVIRDRHPQMLAQRWPSHIPPPKKQDVYDNAQIEELIPVVDALEADLEIPFGATDPAKPEPAKRTLPTFPKQPEPDVVAVPMPDEGDMMPEAAADLKQRFDRLDDKQRKWVGGVVKEANAAQLPIRVGDMPTSRRVHIASTLFSIIEHRLSEQKLRDLLAVVLDDDSVLMASLPLGAALGTCSATQAAELCALAGLGTTVTTGGDNNE